MSQIKAVSGDSVHQLVAIYYYKAGKSPAEVIEVLKESGYCVKHNNQIYSVQATSIASIMTGIAIANPAKNKKLSPIDNGTDKSVPAIPEI